MTAEDFLRSRNICTRCQMNHIACVAGKPDDVEAHEHYWHVMNVTARRPWWTPEEAMQIIVRGEAQMARALEVK